MPIQQVSPELERIVSLDQEVEVLGTGYVGGEGPLWWKESQSLLFSEVRGNRRREWSAQRRRFPGRRAHQQRQRPHPRPSGKIGHVRGRSATGDPDGTRWKCYRNSQQIPRYAIETAPTTWL